MHQTFTGSSRRPRQVNLSGRNSNPFAATSAHGGVTGPQQALKSAAQERAQRQRQRDEVLAARHIQRIWRGHASRKRQRALWRRDWDTVIKGMGSSSAFGSLEQCRSMAKLLCFYQASDVGDVARLVKYISLVRGTIQHHGRDLAESRRDWEVLFIRIVKACLSALLRLQFYAKGVDFPDLDGLCQSLVYITSHIPTEIGKLSRLYYTAMADVSVLRQRPPGLIAAITTPLSYASAATYDGFVEAFLTKPHHQGLLDSLCPDVDEQRVSDAAFALTQRSRLDFRSSLWLLSQLIYITRAGRARREDTSVAFSDISRIPTFGRLLATVSSRLDIRRGPDVDNLDNLGFDQIEAASMSIFSVRPNSFVYDALNALVDQQSIRSLLASIDRDTSISAVSGRTEHLAGYALTLLRSFPHRADDIMMWLYLGSHDASSGTESVSATKYFWAMARTRPTFKAIFLNPRNAIARLADPARTISQSQQAGDSTSSGPENSRKDWQVILLFLEIYNFGLRLMDDEEFLGSRNGSNRGNALSVDDVSDLTIFLKNLGFAMLYYSKELIDAIESPFSHMTPASSLSRYFAGSAEHAPATEASETIEQTPAVGGIVGMTLDYFKGVVLGLLRSLYEKDSRRHFLPKGHWLMTAPFDMVNFIQAVVLEEENRHALREQEGQDVDVDVEDIEMEVNMSTRDRQRLDSDRRRLALRQASHKRYLESVSPRLEILQNMPYLVDFQTRVMIFREFVNLDKQTRRHGHVDPDQWRQSLMNPFANGDREVLARHHATIRRDNVLTDAFEQFYRLGSGLKEPIQITFIDQHGMEEAGIDGGGVTKEFLTSVAADGFEVGPDGFFVENSQHLIYPDPLFFDRVRHWMVAAEGWTPDHPEYRRTLVDCTQQFEFLGRVVGKCLYEGILIDVAFAGFFLIKWALTGGRNAATNETSYRASINDLRDLDEGLYQGLLKLKNYPGNVEEDFGLNFQVNDDLAEEGQKSNIITYDLVPGGKDKAVTKENRLLYITCVARYRLQGQMAKQTNAFLKGLSSIVDPSWLAMFNQSELQTLIGGAATRIDLEDLRRNTAYGGLYVIGDDGQEHPTVKMFWKVVQGMEEDERKALLKFVTSTPRAPLLGFASLNPRFSIRDSGNDERRFPTASTCVNLLKLPVYKNEVVLKAKLLDAVNSGAGFDLS